MNRKNKDENTRYYLDLDLKRRVVLNWIMINATDWHKS